MNSINNSELKAVILAAGMGSRLQPLTDNCPKCLLLVGGSTILERMITNIQACGINEIVFVLGYLGEEIESYVVRNFPDLTHHFIYNQSFEATNTGYSLLLAETALAGTGFVKFDADVVFDREILDKLIANPFSDCLCLDRNIQLEAEEVKVLADSNHRVLQVSKTVNPKEALGESIGIEKIGPQTSKLLFFELRSMMQDTANHQDYYEAAYERLIDADTTFHAVDITGHNWTEIDTPEDFQAANQTFGSNKAA